MWRTNSPITQHTSQRGTLAVHGVAQGSGFTSSEETIDSVVGDLSQWAIFRLSGLELGHTRSSLPESQVSTEYG